mmetsp:Transcript_32893/g.94439  ORF Transcript_32893/g.94439 Transcript_32893/m.94439 type:complete len:229 (-) Transcript_32893:275-961(-)
MLATRDGCAPLLTGIRALLRRPALPRHVQRRILEALLEARRHLLHRLNGVILHVHWLDARVEREGVVPGHATGEPPRLHVQSAGGGRTSPRRPAAAAGVYLVSVLETAEGHPDAEHPRRGGNGVGEADAHGRAVVCGRELHSDPMRARAHVDEPWPQHIIAVVGGEAQPSVARDTKLRAYDEPPVIANPRRGLVSASQTAECVGIGVEPPTGLVIGRLRRPMVEAPWC